MRSSTDSSICNYVTRNDTYIQRRNAVILAGLISVFWSIAVVHDIIVHNMARIAHLEDQILFDEPTSTSTEEAIEGIRTDNSGIFLAENTDTKRVKLPISSQTTAREKVTTATNLPYARTSKLSSPLQTGHTANLEDTPINENSAFTSGKEAPRSATNRPIATTIDSKRHDNAGPSGEKVADEDSIPDTQPKRDASLSLNPISRRASTHQQHQQYEFEIVHIVTTRFQMKQGHAPLLARARFHLFETFCLPTLRQQNNQNFLWMILTDPALDDELLSLLKDSLQNMPNAYLTLTDEFINNNHGIDPIQYYRDLLLYDEEGRESNNTVSTVTGDRTRLDNLMGSLFSTKNATAVLVLDTLLDADDGFHHWTIDGLQKDALAHASQLMQQQEQKQQHIATMTTTTKETTSTHTPLSLSNSWWISAVSSHYEWHNRDVYLGPISDSSQVGRGIIGRRDDATKMAISAGLTRAGILERDDGVKSSSNSLSWFPDSALRRHDRVGALPRCGLLGEQQRQEQDSGVEMLVPLLTQCQKRVIGNFTSTIKARTVTSNSMDDVTFVHNISDYQVHPSRKDFENELLVYANQTAIWEHMRRNFGVQSDQALRTSQFLFDNAALIAQEQMNATCVDGWHAPCLRNRLQNMKHIYKLTKSRLNKKKQY